MQTEDEKLENTTEEDGPVCRIVSCCCHAGIMNGWCFCCDRPTTPIVISCILVTDESMNRYCKKCRTKLPHVKAGWSSGRQLWQCPKGHRHTESSEKKKTLTTTVAVRLKEEELEALNRLPGKNTSDKIRFAITEICPF